MLSCANAVENALPRPPTGIGGGPRCSHRPRFSAFTVFTGRGFLPVVDGVAVTTAQHRPANVAAHGEPGELTENTRKALILGKVVLVTGVARQLGGRFVRRIQRDPQVDRVIAVDAVPPGHHLGGADFVQVDIRQPAIARLLA